MSCAPTLSGLYSVDLGDHAENRCAGAISRTCLTIQRSPGTDRFIGGDAQIPGSDAVAHKITRRWTGNVRGRCRPVCHEDKLGVVAATMPRIVCRVVCGRFDVMAIFLTDERFERTCRCWACRRKTDEAGTELPVVVLPLIGPQPSTRRPPSDR